MRSFTTLPPVIGLIILVIATRTALATERAILLFEPDSGRVLVAEHANRPSFPASLTKLMTVYLLFDALDRGQLGLDDKLTVSAHAASQPPKKIGLTQGTQLRLETVLLAIVVSSGNDAAVVAAEAVSGSEAAFVERMNAKAGELGMRHTRFRNASGLPDPGQVSTALDMAILARRLHQDYSHRFKIFSTLGFDLGERRLETHNNFVRGYRGSTGLKTGFTCHAGYNLVAGARRDGRDIMGVVLGSRSAGRRDAVMIELFDRAFSDPALQAPAPSLVALAADPKQGADETLNQKFLADSCLYPNRGRKVHTVSRWTLEFGIEVERDRAAKVARDFIRKHRKRLGGGRPLLIPRPARDIIYRIAITDLDREKAFQTCMYLRSQSQRCIIIPAEVAKRTVTRALKTLEWIAANPVSQ